MKKSCFTLVLPTLLLLGISFSGLADYGAMGQIQRLC